MPQTMDSCSSCREYSTKPQATYRICSIREVLVDSQSGDESSQLRLADVLRDIEHIDGDLTIYRERGPLVDPSIRIRLVDEEIDGEPEGMAYLLEVHLVRDVIRVWKSWRSGREPSVEEACAAIGFYAAHDAFQPVDLTVGQYATCATVDVGFISPGPV